MSVCVDFQALYAVIYFEISPFLNQQFSGIKKIIPAISIFVLVVLTDIF